MKVRCWSLTHEEIEEVGETMSENFSPDGAAEAFVARHFSDWDYPSQVEVATRILEDGAEHPIQTFVVDVESEPVFYSRLKK